MIASTQGPKIQKFIRGDSRTLNIPITNTDGTPFNLTGCTVYFTLNSSQTPTDDGTDATAALKKSVTTFNNPTPAAGIAKIILSNADTQPLTEDTYWYDIQLKDNTGNITSLARNTFQVIDDITTRVT